jgi:hypothetical protein
MKSSEGNEAKVALLKSNVRVVEGKVQIMRIEG